MKNKFTRTATIAVFLIWIFSFGILTFVSEKEAFSDNENRVLSTRPDLSVSALVSGSFDEAFETFFSDQFVLRDRWIEAKAALRKSGGSIENNDVYFAGSDTLVRRFASYKESVWNSNLKAVASFSEKSGLQANVLLVPTAAWSKRDTLPAGAWDLDQAAMIEEAAGVLNGANVIRVAGPLAEEENTYFRTDHHWNAEGARIGYEAVCREVLHKEPSRFTYEKVSDSFCGTMYSRSGAFWTKPDELFRIVPGEEHSVTMDCDGTQYDSIYLPEKLSQKDQYTYYIGGNHALTRIDVDNGRGNTALIIKDSYAHILVPYLCAEYEHLILVDLRYWRAPVSDLIEDHEHTDLYVIYSVDNFAQDPNAALLR